MAEQIICPVTPWYLKRMSLMAVMFVGFGLYFLYDGFIGYPKKNAIFRAHERFAAIQEEKVAFLNEGGTQVGWAIVAQEEGYPEQSEWSDYAAVQGWPEEAPEKLYSTADQFFFGVLCLVIGLGVLGTLLVNRRRVLRADEESFYTPRGERVPFTSAYRIDMRKWDNKGLAYVHYRDEKEKERRAIIDDLKFAGADEIRSRLMKNFEGELVERVSAGDDKRVQKGGEPGKADSLDAG